MRSFLAVVAVSFVAASTAQAHSYTPKRVVPGDVLLKLSGIDRATYQAADFGDTKARARIDAVVNVLRAAEPTLTYKRRLPIGWGLFHVDASKDLNGELRTEGAVDALMRGKGVVGAAPNAWKHILRTPNDQFFSFMWHLQAIGMPAAWDVTTGAAGQTVGVVDTGTILEHEDLVGKDAGGFDFVADPSSGHDGDGRDGNYEDPGDGCGSQEGDSFHGTHVAGTILANGNNGTGISGINWEAKLVTVRVLGCGGGATVDIMEGMLWAAGDTQDAIPLDPNNTSGPLVPPIDTAIIPHVFNLSLGGAGQCDQFSDEVTQSLDQAGFIVVVAAGNDSQPGAQAPVDSPGNCPGVLAVAAYGADGGLTSYSSFGDEVKIVAPGGSSTITGNQADGVLSCANPIVTGQGNPPYIFEDGTSMATPHVTGTISLLLSLNPGLTRTDVIGILQSTGDSCRDCGSKLGLRADLAVAAVTQVSTSPGQSCQAGVCSPGQACANNVCEVSCGSDADCNSNQQCSAVGGVDVCVPRASSGEGEGEGEGNIITGEGEGEHNPNECDPNRGNMDCPTGQGCGVDGTGNNVCINGLDSGDDAGALCAKDSDCSTGLCELGVCTVTCDFDNGSCKTGYTCDEQAAPGGGLCEPDSCRDQGAAFCGDLHCSYSPEQHYVCASPPSNFTCSDVGSLPSAKGAWLGLGALLLGAGVFSRRRRTTAACDQQGRRCS